MAASGIDRSVVSILKVSTTKVRRRTEQSMYLWNVCHSHPLSTVRRRTYGVIFILLATAVVGAVAAIAHGLRAMARMEQSW